MFAQVTVKFRADLFSPCVLRDCSDFQYSIIQTLQKQIREISKESARSLKTQHIIVDVKGKNAHFPETCRYGNRILTNLRSGGPSSHFLWKAGVSLSSRQDRLAQVKFSHRSFKAVLREWGGAALNSLRRLLARASFS